MALKPLRLAPVLLLTTPLAGACSQVRDHLAERQTRDLAAWEYYDGCTMQVTTFVGMVLCGADRLDASCKATPSAAACGPAGRVVASYADSLMKLVEDKKITEAEARRRWAQFELRTPAEQSQAAQAAAAAARAAR